MVLGINANGVKITGIEYGGLIDKVFVQFPGSNEEYMVDLNYNGDEAFFIIGDELYSLNDFVKV